MPGLYINAFRTPHRTVPSKTKGLYILHYPHSAVSARGEASQKCGVRVGSMTTPRKGNVDLARLDANGNLSGPLANDLALGLETSLSRTA